MPVPVAAQLPGIVDASGGAISPTPHYDCLALDLATSCGFDGPAGSGVASFDPSGLLEAMDRQAGIFDLFGVWLTTAIDVHNPHVLVLEEYGRASRGHAARILNGLRGIALMTARRRELLLDTVNVSRWKPWAKKNLPDWFKDDEQDAIAMRAYWRAEQARYVVLA